MTLTVLSTGSRLLNIPPYLAAVTTQILSGRMLGQHSPAKIVGRKESPMFGNVSLTHCSGLSVYIRRGAGSFATDLSPTLSKILQSSVIPHIFEPRAIQPSCKGHLKHRHENLQCRDILLQDRKEIHHHENA